MGGRHIGEGEWAENAYCLLSSLQEVNADEFEDKEWTFVIEGVSILYFTSTLLHFRGKYYTFYCTTLISQL